MDIQEAKEVIVLLCSELKVRRPKLEFTNRGTWGAGHYIPSDRKIVFNPNTTHSMGDINVLLHEFAHHVEYSKNGGRRAEKNRSHGPQFKAWLTRIAEAWYGDASLYPWQHEYKSLRNGLQDH